MSDTVREISVIQLPSGTSYNIKDASARVDIEDLKSRISGGMHYLGKTTTALTDGSTTNPIAVDGKSVTAGAGDIVIYGNLEFIYSDTESKWHEFGSTGSLKGLAFKDSATGEFTPSGTVTQPTFNGSSSAVSVVGTPLGAIKTGSGTANYTPSGTLSGGAISVTLNTNTRYTASSTTGGGSVSAGSAASCSLPTLTLSVDSETLNINWNAGSFTPNTPTTVKLPTFESTTVASSVNTSTITTQPTFNGTGANLVFEGSSTTSTGSFTPSGTVTQPTFSGSKSNISVS